MPWILAFCGFQTFWSADVDEEIVVALGGCGADTAGPGWPVLTGVRISLIVYG
jgi:hypothetical protein